jgi:hypothetical protein
MFRGVPTILSGLALFFAAMPAGTTYKLQSYGVGSGGVANSVSGSYALEGTVGEVSGTQMSGTTYKIGAGLIPTQLANVPNAPTLTNPANYYNKLNLVLDTGNNPDDTKFAIAISSDNFVTTQYVKSDHTVSSSLAITDYQTFAAWGGASGFNIIGLLPTTTYTVKVRAMQGKFTESGWSPTASATTANPALTFDIDVSNSDVETSPPYNLSFPDLTPGTVVTGSQKIWTDFDTNGDFGGNIYIVAKNGGLKSTAVAYTIAALSGDLGSLAQGFGAQNSSLTQATGGPMTVTSPYDGTSNNVGVTDTSIRKIYGAGAPVTAGRTSLQLKAKSQTLTPSATDYSEILTVIAAASF